ncbi:glycoside hydrolase family 18 protein [Athelia psychrophila]|uniref:Glycoside hydrolase family 18 protein n=1 Tax=Athelia psychrophila TaxID=1759441 RepID=A0A166T7N9_9AGAM|nr:glycoside hydrolase family 18 protein [Fibularhizoctonia sp. CBS 109695]
MRSASISNHTTASSPRPHVLYNILVTLPDAGTRRIQRRYSEFVALHLALGDTFALPPKRLLVTTFIPSAWVDDALISERKAGLSAYLINLVHSPKYGDHDLVSQFLGPAGKPRPFDLEDALPSTLSRGTAAMLDKARVLENDDSLSSTKPIAAGYYEDWATSPAAGSINFSKFDVIFFAFATPSSSYGISLDSGSASMLKTLVTGAHKSGTKVVLSVGGWGGCEYYSALMKTSANRTTFINALSSAVSKYDLDGIDIDWEYPNDPGAGQPYSSADSANFLLFLKSFRSKLGSSKIISAAVTQLPWLGSNGKPLTNVSAYTDEMTYVNIMNYDVNSSSAHPGANAPLSNACGTSSQPTATAAAAFKQWTAAGCPASKLLLGLPLYGYVSKSTATKLSGSFKEPGASDEEADVGKTVGQAHPRQRARHGAEDGEAATGDLNSWFGQQIPFNSLLSSGALVKNSDGTYGAANGYTRAWDSCSSTPFLHDTSRQTVVTYDDTVSLADKAAYAKSVGMGGCFTWALDQDNGTALQSVIRSSLGI